MFGAATLLVLGLLLLVSLLTRQAALFVLVLALLLAAGLSRLYERRCLSGLTYQRHLSRRRVAFGETVELEMEIVNAKVLPLAWLEVEDEIPHELPPRRGRVLARPRPTRPLLSALIALRPYERVRRRYQIPCSVRGEHVFGPARLRTGDLFGLVTKEITLTTTETLVVFPRVVPLTTLGLPAHQPLGDRRTQSWLFEDPSRMAGVREYRPGESPRRVHWAATARAQRLQSRVYEATTSHRLLLCLNVRSVPTAWATLEYDPEAVELAILATASIAAWALEQRLEVGLTSNGMHRLNPTPVAVAPSGDPGHLPTLLEALGRLQLVTIRPFESTLTEAVHRLTYGTTLVVVSPILTPPVATTLLGLRRRGHPVVLVYAGRAPLTARLDGVLLRQVGPPGAWRDLPALAPGGSGP